MATKAQPLAATLRRNTNLCSLVEALAAGPMDALTVASLLDCSLRCAYQYLDTLTEAEVIVAFREAHAGVGVIKGYRLHPDPLRTSRYLLKLRQPAPRHSSVGENKSRANAPGRRVHVLFGRLNDTASIELGAPQRDPLVAALFGACSRQAA